MRRTLAVGLVMGLSLMPGRGLAQRLDPPAPPSTAGGESPLPIFLDGPGDLETLRARLKLPDFVILRGSTYQDLLAKSVPAKESAGAALAVVEALTLDVQVRAETAGVSAWLTIQVRGKGPEWVPIRLDGPGLRDAREEGKSLPLRASAGGWEIRLEGAGAHRVEVDLTTIVGAVRGSPELRRLEIATVEAASTELKVGFPSLVRDVAATNPAAMREPLDVEPSSDGKSCRARTWLTPRSRVEVVWRCGNESGPGGSPLVTAQGDIALDVDRGSLRARSLWDLRVKSGTLRRIDLRIDPSDELVSIHCDDRPVSAGPPTDAAPGTLGVVLPTPLEANQTCRLVVVTQRAFSPEATSRTTYRGVPLLGVASQSGVLAISQRGNDPWVSTAPGRGLRQIDPRDDLPATLRNRPYTILAYQFNEQPFDLGMQIDPAPPWVRVESRTTVFVEDGHIRVDTWLDYLVSRGRIFEVAVAAPEGLVLEPPIGQDNAVAMWDRMPDLLGSGKVVMLRLQREASESGKFSIHLAGTLRQAGTGLSRVPLFRAMNAQSRSGQIAVRADRNIAVELARQSLNSGDFAIIRPDRDEVPGSIPDRSGSSTLALTLRQEDAATELPLRIALLDPLVAESSTMDAEVDTAGATLTQTMRVEFQNGVPAWLDVDIPRSFGVVSELGGEFVKSSERLPSSKKQVDRHRLWLAKEVVDRVRLTFRARQTAEIVSSQARGTSFDLPAVRLDGATSASLRYQLTLGPGLAMAGETGRWAATESGSSPGVRTRWTRTMAASDAPPAITVQGLERAAMPRLVASRLRIQTSQDADARLHHVATYLVERHEGDFEVLLPPDSEWVRARVDGREVSNVLRSPGPPISHRLSLPNSPQTHLVTLEYITPLDPGSGGWAAPQLADHGVVEDVLWEVQIPWHLAIAGVPTGWSDENRWNWRTYAFMRTPRLNRLEADAWIHGGKPTKPDMDDPGLGTGHTYAFSMLGNPTNLRLLTIHRASLVGICSGGALLIGFAVIFGRIAIRTLFYAVILIAIGVACWVPSSLIMLVGQSSSLGSLLAVLAVGTQRFVDARRLRRPGLVATSDPQMASFSASALAGPPDVGSDESTIVRAKNYSEPLPSGSHSGAWADRSSTIDR